MKYRKKSKVVEANQFVRNGECPLGVRTAEDGTAYVVPIQGNRVPIKPGEWAVQEDDGFHYYPVADEVFRRDFEYAFDHNPIG